MVSALALNEVLLTRNKCVEMKNSKRPQSTMCSGFLLKRSTIGGLERVGLQLLRSPVVTYGSTKITDSSYMPEFNDDDDRNKIQLEFPLRHVALQRA